MATTSSRQANGPHHVPMYQVKPAQSLDVVSLPKVMYKVGSYHKSSQKDMRDAWKRCSRKRAEEEAMLSTCDSEPLDKCHEQLLDPSISGLDRASRTGSPSSVHRLEETASSRLLSALPNHGVCSSIDQDRHSPALVSTGHDGLASDGRQLSTLVDRGSQTNFEVCHLSESPSLEKPLLSKAYIVKTYSLHNATPSPDAHSKFPPSHHSVGQPQCQPSSADSDLSISPLDHLEKRQEDVLVRLEQLQASVSKLSEKYNVSGAGKRADAPATTLSATATTLSASTTAVKLSATKVSATTSPATSKGSSHGQALQASSLACGRIAPDLVISADPSSIPLSLIVLCQSLSDRHRVLMSTYVHSSVSDSVPDKLRALLTSNSGIKRGDCDLSITLIWKKVVTGLQLVVDPTRQTTIEGEANVARYLSRLLNPSHDEADIITATQIDEILDLTQLQILEGKSKEKAAAVRTLNSQLGKRDWLTGAEPSVADIVCWSALQQTNQTVNPPANVKKWLSLCGQHKLFQTASTLTS